MISQHDPLPPGSTIGILGGGQLGRMLATAAAELGMSCHIYCPDPDSPAFQVAQAHTVADYGDRDALEAFAHACDVVTYEFENVPAPTVEILAAAVPVRPSGRSLAVCQDRLEEKRLLEGLGIGTARWRQVDRPIDVIAGIDALGLPALLKTRRFGYDGKGQAWIDDSVSARAAWQAIGAAPALLEAVVPFAREVSVIAVRGADGRFAAYDPVENRHSGGILRTSLVPAAIGNSTAAEAVGIARRVAEALDHVGVLAVEMFVVEADGSEALLVNEIAPRVHNTGHWTIEACGASQFESHIRAVAGWPIADTARWTDAEMTNLIGSDADNWRALAAEPGACLHLYGKSDSRPGRKMGHVTRLRRAGAEMPE